jgi:23S rRNA (cytidine2498-2'-O)-methyltransferase
MAVVIAQCRAGFDAEAAEDLARLFRTVQAAASLDVAPGRGYVIATAPALDAAEWRRACARMPPIFVRTWFVGSGPHVVSGATDNVRPDRVAPIVRAMLADAAGAVRSVWVEFPDTNEGKALSTLARALEPRIEAALRERGLIDPAARARGHVFLADGSRVYVGTSDVDAGSAWPMGIVRLRMPHGAPSRSASKLAEAFLVFLGAEQDALLKPGMRAVDLGAAPGGWSWHLAQRGLKVTAVDNGALKGDVAIDPRVTHVRADGLAWRPRTPVDWLTCDIVLQPIRIAMLTAGWIAEGAARRAIVNLKLPMKKRYAEVERCEAAIRSRLREAGVAADLRFRQLYHDREEVTLYIARRG